LRRLRQDVPRVHEVLSVVLQEVILRTAGCIGILETPGGSKSINLQTIEAKPKGAKETTLEVAYEVV
jgi:hypothetical protein